MSGTQSDLESVLLMQIRAAGLPEPTLQYQFAPPRKWRADFCWPTERLIAEVQGGQWAQGRHTRGQGYEDDCERLNAAQLGGWTMLYFTGGMIRDGRAVVTLEKALKG